MQEENLILIHDVSWISSSYGASLSRLVQRALHGQNLCHPLPPITLEIMVAYFKEIPGYVHHETLERY